MQLGSQVFLVEFIARPNRGPVHITRSRSVPTLRREKERDIYISKKRRNDVSRLFLLLFLSTLLLPSRAHTYAGRKHCFHSFINLAEGNIYRRIHGCTRGRVSCGRILFAYAPHWNWFRPGRWGALRRPPERLILALFRSLFFLIRATLLFGATRGKAHLTTHLEHFLD